MENFYQTLNECKRRVRRIFNGFYIDKNEYLEDFPEEGMNIKVNTGKLTPHMRDTFEKKCENCVSKDMEGCKFNNQQCWDELYNPIPRGLMAYLLSTPYKSAIVRNEITDAELKFYINDYKEKTGKADDHIKELLMKINQL